MLYTTRLNAELVSEILCLDFTKQHRGYWLFAKSISSMIKNGFKSRLER
jgi:hypothetical protein